MPRILIELTNRCNLQCAHCYDERHGASGYLSSEVIDKILADGRDYGIDHVVFTGGEPTLHPEFRRLVPEVVKAGMCYSFVTNGSTFPSIVDLIKDNRDAFRGVTFSLDGASPKTHDGLRGKGSFRRVMQAVTLCVFSELPFTLNTVVTAKNRHEIAAMVELANRIGSGGLRFGHLISNSRTMDVGLDLSPQARREVEADIWSLRGSFELAVDMAPGYYCEDFFFPCGPLKLDEYNVDYKGNLTLCCQLSGLLGMNRGKSVAANLHEVDLKMALGNFHAMVNKYLEDKLLKYRSGELNDLDHFPCLYCIDYVGLSQKDRVSMEPDVLFN